MRMWSLVIILGSALCAPTVHADERPYGLTTQDVLGVSVTRGKPKPLPQRVVSAPSEARSVVSLDRSYRGPVFGQHHILRDGQSMRRRTLRPVRQGLFD